MTPEQLRERLSAVVAAEEPGAIAHGRELAEMLDDPPVPAAVLVPFVLGEAPGVLLTKSTATGELSRRAHGPGGRRRGSRRAARGA
jgi:hypothetical protein